MKFWKLINNYRHSNGGYTSVKCNNIDFLLYVIFIKKYI